MITADCQAVLDRIMKEKVRFVDLLVTGMLGELKCVTVTAEEMPATFESDKGVDGSSVLGFARLEESDQVLVPDPLTFRVYPDDVSAGAKTACIFCNVHNPDRSLFAGSPRGVLMNMLERVKAAGAITLLLMLYFSPSIEITFESPIIPVLAAP